MLACRSSYLTRTRCLGHPTNDPGTPTISAACKMINRSHMAAALVFDFATKFDMQEHTRFVVDVTKAGMAEDAMVDVGMMSNYDLRLSMDLLKML